MERKCGDCTLCCKLMPVKEIGKGANERCQHQSRKGCAVYHQPTGVMPYSCKVWSCAWLVAEDAAYLSRPDRSRCVVDVAPDYVVAEQDGQRFEIPVVQIWCDPKSPDAWEALKPFIERRGQDGYAALIRYNSADAITVFPPALTGGEWFVKRDGKSTGKESNVADIYAKFYEGNEEHTLIPLLDRAGRHG